MKFNVQRISLFFLAFCLLVILVLKFTLPLRERKLKEKFTELQTRELFELSAKANKLINRQEKILLLRLKELRESFANEIAEGRAILPANILTEYEKEHLFSISIWEDDSLIIWLNDSPPDVDFTSNILPTEVFFSKKPLTASVSAYDTLTFAGRKYLILLSEVIEKFYKLNNDYYQPVSLNKKFTDLLNVQTILDFNREAVPSDNPGVYSFVIYNNFHNKIGLLNFEKPRVRYELKLLRIKTKNIISIFLILAFVFLALVLFRYFKKLKTLTVTIVLIITAIVFRYLIYFTDILQNIFKGEITSPQYFSSKFGGGITSNPLELFITILFGSVVSLIALKYFNRYLKSENINSKKQAIIGLIAVPAFLPLYFRGFAASVQSFIFGPSIRYFSQNSLFPGWIKLFMLFNLFLLGSVFFNFLFIFVAFYIKKSKEIFPLKTNHSTGLYFLSLLILFSLFNTIYPHLLLSYFLKLIIMSVVIAVVFLAIKVSELRLWNYLALLMISSIFTLIILSSFSNQYKKRALRIAAKEYERAKVNLYKFWLKQLLRDIKENNSVKKALRENANMNAEAFKIWSHSPFQSNNVPIKISFVGNNSKIIGEYSFNIDNSKYLPYKNLTLIKNNDYPEIQKQKDYLIGRINIRNEHQNKLIAVVILKLKPTGIVNEPPFIISRTMLNKIRVSGKDIFSFKIIGNNVKYELGSLELPEYLVKKLIKDVKGKDEVWDEIKMNDDSFLIYLYKTKRNNKKLIAAIGLRENDLSVVWFHFVKLFFYHSLIILFIMIVVFIADIIKRRKLKFNFRFRLISSFLIVAIIPLILLASYLRNLTYSKNYNSTRENLKDNSSKVVKYIRNHWGEDAPNIIFDNAYKDLGINYSVFSEDSLLYSSFEKYYDVSLLSPLVNYRAKSGISGYKVTEIMLNDKIENFQYSSYFRLFKINDYPIVLEVNNAFNEIILPMTASDFDVFLFGIYSIAIIITLLISALLANQISNPIHKLTRAAAAVGEGDLELRLPEIYYGEIGELIKGFNLMVKRLKKSQQKLSTIEREIAWREMAKQIAHEIKNPLTPMKLNVQHLKAAYKDKAENFESILFNVTNNLIKQIETLKSIATEFGRFAKMPVPVSENIDIVKIVKDVSNLYLEENLTVKFNYNKPVFIKGDESNLRRALVNLVRNAIQANASRLEFVLTETDNKILLDVSDNGSGIKEEIRNKIFETDFTTKKEGMGMGLPIVKSILTDFNATINLLETSPAGTTFRIVFQKITDK